MRQLEALVRDTDIVLLSDGSTSTWCLTRLARKCDPLRRFG